MKPFQIFVASFFGLFIAYLLVSVGKVYFENGSVSTFLLLMITVAFANYLFYLISSIESNMSSGYKAYSPTFKKRWTYFHISALIFCALLMVILLFSKEISRTEIFGTSFMLLCIGIYLFRLIKTKKSH